MSSKLNAALKEQSKVNVEARVRDEEENAPAVSEAEEAEAKEVEKEQIKDKLDALRAASVAALQSIRLKQEREKQAAAAAAEDATDAASSVSDEDESVPADVVEVQEDPLEAFPVPAGTNPAETWVDRVDDVVNTSEETEGVEASTYRFDGMPDDDHVDGLAALEVANKGTMVPSEMYEWLSDVKRDVPKPVTVAAKRRHAPWPGEVVFCKTMVDGIAHDPNVKCSYPLKASAHKEDFYVRQMDPTRNRGMPRAFQMPVTELGVGKTRITSGPVVVLSAALGKVTNTLGVELKATLAQPAVGALYPQIGEFVEDEGEMHIISEENLALFNSPEFRRWSGVDAQLEKDKLRQFTSESQPIHERNIDPSDADELSDEDKAGMKEYIDVPLVDSPRDLAQFLVLSHAAELRIASANLGKMIHLGLTFKATEDYKNNDKYHGHVCVSFAALDLVIDYYAAKYHPSQFVTHLGGLALLMTPVSEHGWTDLREVVDGEHADRKERIAVPTAMLRATVDMTYMPYTGPVLQDNAITPYIAMWDALVRDALRDDLGSPAHKAFRRQVIAAGLEEAPDQSRFMCFVASAHAKLMERDRAAWASTFTGKVETMPAAQVAYTEEQLSGLVKQFDQQSLDEPEKGQLSRAQATLKDAKGILARLETEQRNASQARIALGAGARPLRHGLTEAEANF